jgi:hypothetical protein
MDLERFPHPGASLSMSRRQIFVMRIKKSAVMQDQSHRGTMRVLDWSRPSRRVIALCLVSLYYAIIFDAPDRL